MDISQVDFESSEMNKAKDTEAKAMGGNHAMCHLIIYSIFTVTEDIFNNVDSVNEFGGSEENTAVLIDCLNSVQ